jgi:non-homologous end joining protein Ku
LARHSTELASHIVKSKAGHFHPEKFEDQYEDALKELLRKKQAGQKIEAPKAPTDAKVINLMDALRQSRGWRSPEARKAGLRNHCLRHPITLASIRWSDLMLRHAPSTQRQGKGST